MTIQFLTSLPHFTERMGEIMHDAVPIEHPGMLERNAVILSDPEAASHILRHDATLRVMVLSDTPSFGEGTALLAQGIRGYANTYIHAKHLRQALAAIESGNVWLYPEFMQQLIGQVTGTAANHDALLERLTERERETALLVREGLSNKEIATRLAITERTVKQHMSHIFEKLGVGDRLSLAMLLKS